MKDIQKPIAVFDSGVGGISILNALTKELPKENFIYIDDSFNAPYGVKSIEEINKLVLRLYRILRKRTKAFVIACNTATAASADNLRNRYPDNIIIGTEPAIKPACQKINSSNILVLATPSTIKSERLHSLIEKYSGIHNIIPLEAPDLVCLVEKDALKTKKTKLYLKELLKPYIYDELYYTKLQAIIMGCTHFSFAKDAILATLHYPCDVYDSCLGVAAETKRRLEEENLLKTSGDGLLMAISTSRDKHHQEIVRKLSQKNIEKYADLSHLSNK